MVVVVTIAVAVALAAAWMGRAYYFRQRGIVQAQVAQQLEAIGRLKADQISQWRQDLISTASHMASDALALKDVAEWMRGGNHGTSGRLEAWLRENVSARNYESIIIIETDGGRYIASGDRGPSTENLESAERAVADGRTVFVGPYRSGDRIYVDTIAPIAVSGERHAALLIRVDPGTFLYPLIKSWPVPARSSETLLVRRSGDKLVFLNDLRFREDAALNLDAPMSDTRILGVQAAGGATGVRTGIDYRGVPTIGYLSAIPGTDWHIVAKMDQSEAYASVDEAARIAVMGTLLLIIAVVAGVGLAWRTRSSDLYRRRALAEAARAEMAEKFEMLSRYANDAVLLTDADLRLIEVNDRAVELYGRPRERLLAMTLADLHGPASRADAERNRSRIDESGGAVYEAVHVGGSGLPIEVEVSARRIGDDDAPRYISVVRDISERKSVERELERYREQLEEMVTDRTEELTAANEELLSMNEEITSVNEELAGLNEELVATNEELDAATTAKTEFLANMSHELRTPLNSIIGFTGVMLQGLTGDLTDEQRNQLSMIRRSGERLLALINDMLDLSRIEAGRTRVQLDSVELAEIVAAAVETVAPLAADRALELKVGEVPQGVMLHTDGGKLNQVLVNLLANGIKFTDEGSVEIQVTLPDPESVNFRVSDTGVGIRPEDLADIFDEFVQVVRDGAKPEGTGLGLAISRRLSSLLGGRLSASSTPGAGSTFTLVIPRSFRHAKD